jgi:hypothetical protein
MLYSLSYCGGLIGYQTAGERSVITGCYNDECTVTGNNYVGGLLGYSDMGTVRNSYVAADVSGKGYPVGAVIGGSWKVLSYNNHYNPDYQCPDLENGDDSFKSGGRGGKTSEEMRKPEFVTLLNQGLPKPVWKMDYNPSINNGFPILIWQTAVNPLEIATLSSLTVSEGKLTPSFNCDIHNYTVNVPTSITSITIEATPTHPDATVAGTGEKQLAIGSNPFILTVTAANGVSTLNYIVTVTRSDVGIVETGRAPSLQVYPNPTRGELIIVAGQARNDGDMRYEICDIEIFDVMGRKVQSLMFNVQSSETRNFKLETLNISDLPSGIYFLRIQTENGIITKKVIKQ